MYPNSYHFSELGDRVTLSIIAQSLFVGGRVSRSPREDFEWEFISVRHSTVQRLHLSVGAAPTRT